jgi:hypothetical protein
LISDKGIALDYRTTAKAKIIWKTEFSEKTNFSHFVLCEFKVAPSIYIAISHSVSVIVSLKNLHFPWNNISSTQHLLQHFSRYWYFPAVAVLMQWIDFTDFSHDLGMWHGSSLAHQLSKKLNALLRERMVFALLTHHAQRCIIRRL